MIPNYQLNLDRTSVLLAQLRGDSIDAYYAAYMAQLLCIQLSGILEAAIRESLATYATQRSAPEVARYAQNQIESFQNPNPEKILKLLRSFDAEWAASLETYWEGEIKDSIGSIVGQRHLIAHGRATNVSLSRISDWKKSVVKFINFLRQDILKFVN